MRFLKENFDSVIKLFVNQIGVAIFSFFLYTAASTIAENGQSGLAVKFAISVFSIIFYFLLIYNVIWEIGGKDKIRIDAGRMTPQKSKGARLSFIANLPNFIFIGIALLLFVIYMTSGNEGFKAAFAILNALFRIFVSMYLGAIQLVCDSFSENENTYYLMQTIGFLIFPVMSIGISHFAYIMGLNNKKIINTGKTEKYE